MPSVCASAIVCWLGELEAASACEPELDELLAELLPAPPVAMLSRRLMEADEEAIILRKLEASVSLDTKEEASEVAADDEAVELADDWLAPAPADEVDCESIELPDICRPAASMRDACCLTAACLHASDGAFLVRLILSSVDAGLSLGPMAAAAVAGPDLIACRAVAGATAAAATIEAALALAGNTGRVLASASW